MGKEDKHNAESTPRRTYTLPLLGLTGFNGRAGATALNLDPKREHKVYSVWKSAARRMVWPYEAMEVADWFRISSAVFTQSRISSRAVVVGKKLGVRFTTKMHPEEGKIYVIRSE